MPGNDLILDAARSIRPYLPQLAGASAKNLDSSLVTLLEHAGDDPQTALKVLECLKHNQATETWTAEFLNHGQPADVAAMVEKGIQDLPGLGGNVSALKYVCPSGDYIWYRRAVGQQIPQCPTHLKQLEIAT
jgi:hypothetical protein